MGGSAVLSGVVACAVTAVVAFYSVRPFYGIALTKWDALLSPRTGRWVDFAGAVGIALVMLGWFVPQTAQWAVAWGACVVMGATLGIISMRRRRRELADGAGGSA